MDTAERVRVIGRRVQSTGRYTGEYFKIEHRGFARNGIATPCWIWQRATNAKGYGFISVNDTLVRAHRAYYEDSCGAIPEGLMLDHLCSVKSCVNPYHLEPVTNQENVQRYWRKRR